MMLKLDVCSGPRWWHVLAAFTLALLFSGVSGAQDLEPRAYSASPVGTSFAGVGFGRSSGDISFDPTVPITNAHATLYSPALGLGQTFGVFGRQALFTAALPYAWGTASGDVGNNAESVYRSGLADVKARLAVNLRGSPALSVREFAKRSHRKFIIGSSLSITAPSGQYGSTKLINIGTNRWSFKPELGVSYPVKKFDLDLYASGMFFTTNYNFYTGQSVRTQAPLTAIQAHVSYTVRPRLWAAFDATWYGGGASTVDGGAPSERQSNSRLGATISLPLRKQQSLKVNYSSGVSGRIGSKFSTISVGWQYVWFDHR
jgi:Putative MetA-pathway of phenol degradation